MVEPYSDLFSGYGVEQRTAAYAYDVRQRIYSLYSPDGMCDITYWLGMAMVDMMLPAREDRYAAYIFGEFVDIADSLLL